MAWNITAQWIESCNCNMLCPCWFGTKELAKHDQGYCGTADIFRIREGNSDGVALSGLTVASSWYFPGPTFLDGNGTGRVYVDEATTTEQRIQLESIFQGKRGGQLEPLDALIPTWLPTMVTKIELREEGDSIAINVAGVGQLKSRRLKDGAGRPTTMQNASFASGMHIDTLELAPSDGTKWADPEMPEQFEAKSGVVANVYWRGN